MSQATAGSQRLVTDIPARLDRPPWSLWGASLGLSREVFPKEIQAIAIAAVYSGRALIQTGSAQRVFLVYLLGAGQRAA